MMPGAQAGYAVGASESEPRPCSVSCLRGGRMHERVPRLHTTLLAAARALALSAVWAVPVGVAPAAQPACKLTYADTLLELHSSPNGTMQTRQGRANTYGVPLGSGRGQVYASAQRGIIAPRAEMPLAHCTHQFGELALSMQIPSERARVAGALATSVACAAAHTGATIRRCVARAAGAFGLVDAAVAVGVAAVGVALRMLARRACKYTTSGFSHDRTGVHAVQRLLHPHNRA